MQAISLTDMGAAGRRQVFDIDQLAASIMKKVRGTPRTLSGRHRLELVPHDPVRYRSAVAIERPWEDSSKPIRMLGSADVHDGETPSKVAQISEIFSSYDDRLEVLKEQARLDGNSLNVASSKAFSEFCLRYPLMKRARLVLMENGNLRATWKDDNGAHVGLQFQDSQSIQFVIFGRRELELPVQRVSGRVTMDRIMRQIEALDVHDAVMHGP